MKIACISLLYVYIKIVSAIDIATKRLPISASKRKTAFYQEMLLMLIIKTSRRAALNNLKEQVKHFVININL